MGLLNLNSISPRVAEALEYSMERALITARKDVKAEAETEEYRKCVMLQLARIADALERIAESA